MRYLKWPETAAILRHAEPISHPAVSRRMAVTECQGCGAWNDASRAVCVLCSTPLAETDEWDAAAEPPPLPPLPDGGLRASMPTWLREPPGAAPSPIPPPGEAPPVSSIEAVSPLGPRADPRTFLTDDDFPRWLRDLAARRAVVTRPPGEMPSIPPHHEPAPWQPAPATSRPDLAELRIPAAPAPASEPVPAASARQLAPEMAPVANSALAPEVPPAAASAPLPDNRRKREPWETFLLAALVIGVVVAALWALVANGVLGPGL
jgi:hypothetical protein